MKRNSLKIKLEPKRKDNINTYNETFTFSQPASPKLSYKGFKTHNSNEVSGQIMKKNLFSLLEDNKMKPVQEKNFTTQNNYRNDFSKLRRNSIPEGKLNVSENINKLRRNSITEGKSNVSENNKELEKPEKPYLNKDVQLLTNETSGKILKESNLSSSQKIIALVIEKSINYKAKLEEQQQQQKLGYGKGTEEKQGKSEMKVNLPSMVVASNFTEEISEISLNNFD